MDKTLTDKLLTLGNGHHSIHKRGAINMIGTINKWISGSMDDEGRQIINDSLETIIANNHNLIKNMNTHIKIN